MCSERAGDGGDTGVVEKPSTENRHGSPKPVCVEANGTSKAARGEVGTRASTKLDGIARDSIRCEFLPVGNVVEGVGAGVI